MKQNGEKTTTIDAAAGQIWYEEKDFGPYKGDFFFSHSGKYVFFRVFYGSYGSDELIRVWETVSGKEIVFKLNESLNPNKEK